MKHPFAPPTRETFHDQYGTPYQDDVLANVNDLPKVRKRDGFGIGTGTYQRLHAPTVAQRLTEYTIDGDGCWNWNGWCGPDGYGRVRVHQQLWFVHRLAYVHHIGLVPAGMVVRHRCDHHACINPAHLLIDRRRKLTTAQVVEIRRRYVASKVTQEQLADEFAISQTQISRLLRPHLGSAYADVITDEGIIYRPARSYHHDD